MTGEQAFELAKIGAKAVGALEAILVEVPLLHDFDPAIRIYIAGLVAEWDAAKATIDAAEKVA